MKTLGLLIQSVILAISTSLIVSGLFLPVHGILEGGPSNCLTMDVGGCIGDMSLSALIYGPLFCIIGILIGTPAFMILLTWRDWQVWIHR